MNSDLPVTIEQWHRKLCQVNDWLFISGDLSPRPAERNIQIEEWRQAGITDIVDVREEWSDEDFVLRKMPQIRYWHLGTHDDGGAQDFNWFLQGIKALDASREHHGKILVHCHMGINRGPSMAFFFLLRSGWTPRLALDAIRKVRPIAATSYAKDAARANAILNDDLTRQFAKEAQIEKWFEKNDIDVAHIIRRLRASG